MGNEIVCKNCGSSGVVRFGTYKGVQRYWCKVCRRKFKADDTLFHMKTPANKVSSAINMYYEDMSIKAIRRNLQQEYGNMPSTALVYEVFGYSTWLACRRLMQDSESRLDN